MSERLPQLVAARGAATRPRWPYAGGGQRTLLAGSLMIVLGSFLPWVSTPVGNLSGMAGPGLWTFYLGVVGVGGAVLRRRRVALAHAVAVGACGVALPLWQLAHLAQISAATQAWGAAVPSTGLLLVLAGGVLALRAAWRLHTST
ncbi:MAG TPA: hypothetical protein VM287_06185 [Egibacteraceae bacterium]|nr:hypothetical protein [Egibacteraceae bacterium]